MQCQLCGKHAAEFGWNIWNVDKMERVLVCANCNDRLADKADKGERV